METSRHFGLMVWGLTILLFPAATLAALKSPDPVRVEYPADGNNAPAFNASPTIIETVHGITVAWLGSTEKGSLDSAVYLSRRNAQGTEGSSLWSDPVKVVFHENKNTGMKIPCRRPVLFQPTYGNLLLFYQTPRDRNRVTGWLTRSEDQGITWTVSKSLPRKVGGPARSRPLELRDGTLLVGGDDHTSGTRVHVERAKPFGDSLSWEKSRHLSHAMWHNASEPVFLNHGANKIQLLCRSKRGRIMTSSSENEGKTWSEFKQTDLPNPDSGLSTARILIQVVNEGAPSPPVIFALVYQHSNQERSVLNLALTSDGFNWAAAALLDWQPGKEISDPFVIQGSDGFLHIVYSIDRQRIKYLVINPNNLSPLPMASGNWPF